jgi:hypothetical protein
MTSTARLPNGLGVSDRPLLVTRGFLPGEDVDHLRPGGKPALTPGQVAAKGPKARDNVRGVLAGIMAEEAALVHGSGEGHSWLYQRRRPAPDPSVPTLIGYPAQPR